MTIKTIFGFLGLWMFVSNVCLAQLDSTNHKISRAFYVSISHLNPQECKAVETPVTVVVTFDSSALVENIFLSKTDDCLKKNKTGFPEFLTSELNKLNLEKKEFSESYILVVLFITKMGETKTISRSTDKLFVNMFNGLDEEQVADKKLKLWLPMTYNIYKSPH